MHQFNLSFEAIGTNWSIDVFDAPASISQALLKNRVGDRIETFDRAYSRFRPDSLITHLSHSGGSVDFPPDFPPLYSLYHELYSISHGAFTPLIGRTMEESGYDAQYSLKPRPLSRVPRWENIITYAPPTLRLAQPITLDFGAAGKGYLIDLLGDLLESIGLHNYTIDAGGDILHRSYQSTPLRVGLENPLDTQEVIGVATLHRGSICASAGNRRQWSSYHHIINPHTLSSPRDVLSVWVIAEHAILADALATCLFLIPPATLTPKYNFQYLVLDSNLTCETSPEFPAEIFTQT